MHDSNHGEDAGRRKTQEQKEQNGNEGKDKKNRSEKKQVASARGEFEQKSVKEPESGRGPVLPGWDDDTVDRMIEENEGYQEFIEQL